MIARMVFFSVQNRRYSKAIDLMVLRKSIIQKFVLNHPTEKKNL